MINSIYHRTCFNNHEQTTQKRKKYPITENHKTLVGRIDKNFFVEMIKEQINLHNDYYEQVCKLVNKWIKHGFLTEEESQRLLINLNCMRMVSDSTYILDKETNFGKKTDELRELLTEIVENPENKIVIFSHLKKKFELIIEELNELDLPYVYLNGDVPAHERNEIIKRFQNEKDLRVFLSTDAGGVGVNLQAANILINIDLPWNPAVLEQRILYLLEIKKSVFSGAIDEDGKDTVMLEGFLSSVKSLTEVEVDAPVAKEREESDALNYRAAESHRPDRRTSKTRCRPCCK